MRHMRSKNTGFIAGNAKFLREINTETILRIIRERQPISRIQIARLTGLNKSTISSIVGDLLEKDLILETATSERSVGRSPLNLSLRLGKHFVGAVDVDSPITRVGVVDIDGSVRRMSSIHIDPGLPEESVARCIEELKGLCISLKLQDMEKVGFSIPGIVESRKQIVEFAPNLRWKNFPIGEVVRQLAPEIKDLSMGNGANVSALAELSFGTHEVDLTNFVFLSIHPGIGAGIVIDSRLREGEYKSAGEFGHMVIYDGGEPCQCGNKGCLEAYASDRATVNRYVMKKYGTVNDQVDYELQDIIALAKDGDGTAVEVLKETGYYIGVGISNIIRAIDPHVIIIGGQITRAWDIVYPQIMAVVMQRAYFGITRNVKILPTSLTVPPRLLGAATLAIERMFSDYSTSD